MAAADQPLGSENTNFPKFKIKLTQKVNGKEKLLAADVSMLDPGMQYHTYGNLKVSS